MEIHSQMQDMSFHDDAVVGKVTTEVTCQRSVGGSNFPAGVQDFAFTVSRPYVWLPGQSYLVAEVELLGGGDPATAVQPSISEMLALAENCIGAAYTSAYMYVGGASLDSVSQDHAQIATVHHRVNDSSAYSKSLGISTQQNEPSWSKRCAAVSSTLCYPVNQGDKGTAGPVGISLDGKDEIVKPCAAGFFSTATVAIGAGAPSVINGVNTAFDQSHRGALLYAQGVCYGTVYTVTNATTLGISPNGTTSPAALTATTNWYLVTRNQQRTIQAKNKLQLLFKPPLGVFSSEQYLPPGQYRLSLGPNSNYRLACVESKNETAFGLNPGVGATSPYTFNILDVRLYISTAQKEIVEGIQPHLQLMEYQSFSRTLNATSGSFNFTVPASTEEVYIALQHPSAGSNPVWVPSRFVAANGSDENINALQVSYGGMTKPATRWSSGFANEDPAGRSKAFLTHLYYQSILESNRANDTGGAEDLDSWLQRGPLFCFRFEKDALDRSTELSVQIAYGNGPQGSFATDSKLYVIARYRAKRQLTVQNGQVTQVLAIDA